MKKLLVIVILSAICLPSFSANDGYKIKIKFNGLKDTVCFLGNYFGDKQYYKDTASAFENLDKGLVKTEDKLEKNQGFIDRRQRVLDGNGKLELLTKIHCDIFNTDRYLLNNVELKITYR